MIYFINVKVFSCLLRFDDKKAKIILMKFDMEIVKNQVYNKGNPVFKKSTLKRPK